MLFNSLQFLAFFPVVVLLYWILPIKWRNPVLLLASYYFYMNWEPVYALLILFSTISTWIGALLIGRESDKKSQRLSFVITLLINLAILFTYKYLNFFGSEIKQLLDALGIGINVPKFELLLPVGISFYTFQAIGYLVDVKRGDILPEPDFFTYALFVAFFPQLVAGPIERASRLLPQFHTTHKFSGESVIKGLNVMVIGYFMKLCIAENVAPYVDAVFNNIHHHNGNSILLAAFFFTFQIFCDFGGYSLIAIGAARCMGFSLMQNFRQPYLATSIKDFWRRWHISLSTWFTDYLYIPLGGNRVKPARHYGNLMATFLVSGLWHGANYTFIVWGAYHGLLQCVHVATHKRQLELPKILSAVRNTSLLRIINIGITFVLVMIGWIFFRANTMSDAIIALKKIVYERGMLFNGEGKPAIIMSFLLIALLILLEVYNERKGKQVYSDGTTAVEEKRSLIKSAIFTAFLICVILLTAQFSGGQFIYFQF